MLGRKLSVLQELVDALPKDAVRNTATLPLLEKLQETVKEAVEETVQGAVEELSGGEWISMPFLHNMTHDIRSKWSLQDLNPDSPNDVPNQNLKVMALILATNIESTVGKYAWSLVEYSLERLGFTNIVHYYFEEAEKINHPARRQATRL